MINLPSTFKISLRALRVNKMRSALTMLGIIIGVSAVIIMLAVGTGASKKLSEQISSIGSNLLMIFPGSITAGGMRMGSGSQSTLTLDDAEAIKRECPTVEEVAPILNGSAQLVYGNQNWATNVYGTTPAIIFVRDWSLSAGRIFYDQEGKGVWGLREPDKVPSSPKNNYFFSSSINFTNAKCEIVRQRTARYP